MIWCATVCLFSPQLRVMRAIPSFDRMYGYSHCKHLINPSFHFTWIIPRSGLLEDLLLKISAWLYVCYFYTTNMYFPKGIAVMLFL